MIYILNICYIYIILKYIVNIFYIYIEIKDSLTFIKSLWEKHDHQYNLLLLFPVFDFRLDNL